MNIENYINTFGESMIKLEQANGFCTCFTMEQWADYQAQQVEHLTEIVPASEAQVI